MPGDDPLGADPFEFLNYRRGGPGYKLDWKGGAPTHRMVEAARLGIDRATKEGAELAKHTHPWETRTEQTEDSVFQRLAHYNFEKQEVWGSWGIRSLPREPPRSNEPWDALLTTKDVALLLEFGFRSNRGRGRTVKFPWIYPAWDATKWKVGPYVAAAYDSLPSNFRYRRVTSIGTMPFVSLADAYAGASAGRIVSVD